MKYVYMLQSQSHPKQRYVGITSDVQARLAAHNAGQSQHTSKFRPWNLIAFVAFISDEKAASFEKHLKSGSGRAFAEKRLWG